MSKKMSFQEEMKKAMQEAMREAMREAMPAIAAEIAPKMATNMMMGFVNDCIPDTDDKSTDDKSTDDKWNPYDWTPNNASVTFRIEKRLVYTSKFSAVNPANAKMGFLVVPVGRYGKIAKSCAISALCDKIPLATLFYTGDSSEKVYTGHGFITKPTEKTLTKYGFNKVTNGYIITVDVPAETLKAYAIERYGKDRKTTE